MIRRRHGISLAPVTEPEEDVNPNSFLVNIGDCMLVLLLGTIVALISYYNVDLTQPPETDEIVGIEVNMDQNSDGLIDDNFTERGAVYYDEDTDTYYLLPSEGD